MNGPILVVGQDTALRGRVAEALAQEGFRCEQLASGEEALERSGHSTIPPVIVLDADGLAGMNARDFCKDLRQQHRRRVPHIVILSEDGDEVDRVVAFELGVDDYVVKPFSLRELVLRVRAITARLGQGAEARRRSDTLRLGRIKVDLAGHRVWVDSREVHLTVLEFRLLATLVARRGRVEDRQRLVRDLWGRDAGITARTVDTHIRHLRGKLGPVGRYIETVRGVGYRFQDQPES